MVIENYFYIGEELAKAVRDKLPSVGSVYEMWTVNDVNRMRNEEVSCHINMNGSRFTSDSGHGTMKSETQVWQVALCCSFLSHLVVLQSVWRPARMAKNTQIQSV